MRIGVGSVVELKVGGQKTYRIQTLGSWVGSECSPLWDDSSNTEGEGVTVVKREKNRGVLSKSWDAWGGESINKNQWLRRIRIYSTGTVRMMQVS